MLIKHLYKNNNPRKDTLWFCYGDYIASNLESNVELPKTKLVQCIDCGEWFEVPIKDTKTDRCELCYAIYRRKNKTDVMRRLRNKQGVVRPNVV